MAQSVFGQDYRGAWMVVVTGLTGYFDVSGHPKNDARAYACAGFAAPVSEWTEGFEPAWRDLLQKMAIPEFHMTNVMARKKKGYRHITDAQYEEMLIMLFSLLEQHAHKSFARVIDGGDLPTIKANGDTPLRLAGVEIMSAVEEWRANRLKKGKAVGEGARVRVVFDDGEDGKGTLMDAVGGPFPIFEKSADVLPLQASDWLAWELARLHFIHERHKGHGGAEPVKIRGEVFAAIRHLPKDWKYYDAAEGRWIDIVMTPEEAKRRYPRRSGRAR